MTTLDEALRCAVNTAKEQPGEVPERTPDWIERAQAALEAEDEDAILACANEIRNAHSQYRADFDVKGWLYDLRLVHQNTLPACRGA